MNTDDGGTEVRRDCVWAASRRPIRDAASFADVGRSRHCPRNAALQAAREGAAITISVGIGPCGPNRSETDRLSTTGIAGRLFAGSHARISHFSRHVGLTLRQAQAKRARRSGGGRWNPGPTGRHLAPTSGRLCSRRSRDTCVASNLRRREAGNACCERLRRSVAVLQALEYRAAERVLDLRHVYRLAVALDDELRQSALEVGLGFPNDGVVFDPDVGPGGAGAWCLSRPCSRRTRSRPGRSPRSVASRPFRVARELGSGVRFGAGRLRQPGRFGGHGAKRVAGLFRQAGGEAGVEPGYRQIALVAALVGGERVDGDADEAAAAANREEEGFVRRPHACEAAVFHRHPFLGSGGYTSAGPLGRRRIRRAA